MSKELKHIDMLIGGDIYRLALNDIDKFRKEYGVSFNGLDEEEFIQWARDNNIKFIKSICIEMSVDIDEYLREV
jgi:hypothetical protein